MPTYNNVIHLHNRVIQLYNKKSIALHVLCLTNHIMIPSTRLIIDNHGVIFNKIFIIKKVIDKIRFIAYNMSMRVHSTPIVEVLRLPPFYFFLITFL